MPTIRNVLFDTTDLPATSSNRNITVTGDAGSVFTLYLSNEDNRNGTNQGSYYNFKTQSFVANVFDGLFDVKIPASGRFKTSIKFPTVSDNDEYNIYVVANPHFDTDLSDNLVDKGFIYHVKNIDQSTNNDGSLKFPSSVYQYVNRTITIYVNHDDDSDIKYEADATGSGSATLGTISLPAGTITTGNTLAIPDTYGPTIGNIVGCDSSQTLSLVTATGIILPTHVYAQITKTVNGATTSSTSVVLDDIDNLAIGFVLQSTSSGTIPSTKPTITAIDVANKTLTLSAACSLANDATLTFRGYGSDNSYIIQGLSFELSAASAALSKSSTNESYNVVQKLSSEFTVDSGTTMVLGSTAGIKAGNTINVAGLETTSEGEAITVSSVTNATNIVLTGTMDAENNPVVEAGTQAFFNGSSQQAIIKLILTITAADSDSALYLDLTKFLTLTDNF